MKKLIVLALAAVLCWCAAACAADTVVLKSGQNVEGTIIERTDQYVKVDFDGVKLTYYVDEIATINGQPVAAAAAAAAPVAPAPAPSPVTAPAVARTPASPQYEPVDTFRRQSQPALKQMLENPANRGKIAGFAATFMLILLVFGLGTYIFSAVCLMKIAENVAIGPGWWAWVPIVNVFLMLKIAGLSYWWALSLLVGVIPVIGGLLSLCAFVYIWYKMLIACNKPSWWAFLMVLPVVNWVVMGMVAFSGQPNLPKIDLKGSDLGANKV